jgi:hypothetical protein
MKLSMRHSRLRVFRQQLPIIRRILWTFILLLMNLHKCRFSDTDFRTLDFSYPETHPAYSAASDGGPLGDRNWFPDYVPTGIQDIVKGSFLIYPNPGSDVLYVSLKPEQRVDKVVFKYYGTKGKNSFKSS